MYMFHISYMYIFVGTFGGLAPPPRHTKKLATLLALCAHNSPPPPPHQSPQKKILCADLVQNLHLPFQKASYGPGMFLVKHLIHYLATPLVHIVNLSLSSGVVPCKMKICKIIPVIFVYKKGDKHLFSNYRPITLLPCFSKILEKVVCNRIINHLNQNNLLSCSLMDLERAILANMH